MNGYKDAFIVAVVTFLNSRPEWMDEVEGVPASSNTTCPQDEADLIRQTKLHLSNYARLLKGTCRSDNRTDLLSLDELKDIIAANMCELHILVSKRAE